MRLLGLDYGLKRVGLAIGNSENRLAFPYRCLANRGRDGFFVDILEIAHKECIQGIVVGYPLRHDGSKSETTRQVENMVRRLRSRCQLSLFLVNELLSSYEAEERLQGFKADGIKAKANVDQVAALVILETFFSNPVEAFKGFS